MAAPSIPTRMYATERDLARHDLELVDHDKRINTAERRLDVIYARVAIYATLGAFVGGGAVTVASALLHNHL